MDIRFTAFAQRLSRSPWLRFWLFLACSALAITITGYTFGTFDQNTYIPYFKKAADLSLYPADPFIALREYNYSYFWFMFLPFYRLGILEPALFIIHILTILATFWMMWELSQTLFDNPAVSLLVTLAMVVPHLGFPGFAQFEFQVLNRSVVLPILLYAIKLYLRRRYLTAFLILGLVYNLHVLTVNYVLAMLLFDSLMQIRTIGWRKLFLGMLLFILGGLPVLLWRFGRAPLDLTLRPETFSTVVRGFWFSLFYIFSLNPAALVGLLNGLGTLGLFLIGRLAGPNYGDTRSVTNFVIAIGIAVAIGQIALYWLPVTFFLQLQVNRMGFFLLPFGYLYFAQYIVQKYLPEAGKNPKFGIMAGALIICPFPLLVVLLWDGLSWIVKTPRRRFIVITSLLSLLVAITIICVWIGLWPAGIQIYPPDTPWVEAQTWAKGHTSKDALFITPPQIGNYYTSEWRVFSERSTLVALPDLNEAFFSPQYAEEWQLRFEQAAPGAINRFDGYHADNERVTAEAFYGLSADQFQVLARRYGASYLVVEKPHHYDFPIVYENKGFIIYDLRTSLQ